MSFVFKPFGDVKLKDMNLKRLAEGIANEGKLEGRLADQIRQKLMALVAKYRAGIDKNQDTGNSPCRCKYYLFMHPLMDGKIASKLPPGQLNISSMKPKAVSKLSEPIHRKKSAKPKAGDATASTSAAALERLAAMQEARLRQAEFQCIKAQAELAFKMHLYFVVLFMYITAISTCPEELNDLAKQLSVQPSVRYLRRSWMTFFSVHSMRSLLRSS
jgi:hypothetical protein